MPRQPLPRLFTCSTDDGSNIVDVSSVTKPDTWWRQTGNAGTHLHAARYNATWEVVVYNRRTGRDVVARLQSIQSVVEASVRRVLKTVWEDARRQ